MVSIVIPMHFPKRLTMAMQENHIPCCTKNSLLNKIIALADFWLEVNDSSTLQIRLRCEKCHLFELSRQWIIWAVIPLLNSHFFACETSAEFRSTTLRIDQQVLSMSMLIKLLPVDVKCSIENLTPDSNHVPKLSRYYLLIPMHYLSNQRRTQLYAPKSRHMNY